MDERKAIRHNVDKLKIILFNPDIALLIPTFDMCWQNEEHVLQGCGLCHVPSTLCIPQRTIYILKIEGNKEDAMCVTPILTLFDAYVDLHEITIECQKSGC
jgi:hypothetical protein